MSRRIAMWSGPRNISTAMMRAWGNRPDTVVCDEPLYAHYLEHTGYTHHPGFAEIVARQETDWQKVVAELTGPLPAGKQIYYQKQMGQHLLPHLGLERTDQHTNAFLIRDPREMLLSLLEFFPQPTIEETGLPQQLQLFRREQQRAGTAPAVIDAKDVLLQPRDMLQRLCARLEVEFDECMLHWESGLHSTDGVWAHHWYKNVAKTTTFGGYQPKSGQVPDEHQPLLARCEDIYQELAAHKLRPENPGN